MSLENGQVSCNYCNGWTWTPSHQKHCPGCGTIHSFDGTTIDIGPYRRVIDRIENMGRPHFVGLHKDVVRLERLVRHMAKELKVRFPSGRPRK